MNNVAKRIIDSINKDNTMSPKVWGMWQAVMVCWSLFALAAIIIFICN